MSEQSVVDVRAAIYNAIMLMAEQDDSSDEYAALTEALPVVMQLIHAAVGIEKWWLERGCNNQRDRGAPAEIFNLRAALTGIKEQP